MRLINSRRLAAAVGTDRRKVMGKHGWIPRRLSSTYRKIMHKVKGYSSVLDKLKVPHNFKKFNTLFEELFSTFYVLLNLSFAFAFYSFSATSWMIN